MRLAEFILANGEPILVEWEGFARTCKPASGDMDIEALRDHAGEMLAAIAADLGTPQDAQERAEKSRGNAADEDPDQETAAEEHGAGRAASGFSVEQMVSEYRALRASVIRLWTKEGALAAGDIEDLTRFNEAIDQALAESVARYTDDLEHSKEIFLAVMAHDLCDPLETIYAAAGRLAETQNLDEPARALTARIADSARGTTRMLEDLLDFTRSRLGGGIPIERTGGTIGQMVHDVVDGIAAAHAERKFDVQTRGEQQGQWDCGRISQALCYLVGNAVQHGTPGTPVTVYVDGAHDEVRISIHNRGTAIPRDRLADIFNPARRAEHMEQGAGRPQENLGLGLYIAERIVHAHKGRITVESAEKHGNTFTVFLPRNA